MNYAKSLNLSISADAINKYLALQKRAQESKETSFFYNLKEIFKGGSNK